MGKQFRIFGVLSLITVLILAASGCDQNPELDGDGGGGLAVDTVERASLETGQEAGSGNLDDSNVAINDTLPVTFQELMEALAGNFMLIGSAISDTTGEPGNYEMSISPDPNNASFNIMTASPIYGSIGLVDSTQGVVLTFDGMDDGGKYSGELTFTDAEGEFYLEKPLNSDNLITSLDGSGSGLIVMEITSPVYPNSPSDNTGYGTIHSGKVAVALNLNLAERINYNNNVFESTDAVYSISFLLSIALSFEDIQINSTAPVYDGHILLSGEYTEDMDLLITSDMIQDETLLENYISDKIDPAKFTIHAEVLDSVNDTDPIEFDFTLSDIINFAMSMAS